MDNSRNKFTEAIMPQYLIDKLIKISGDNLILVGGQALAFWVKKYHVKSKNNLSYISRDIDFLARSAADFKEVIKISEALGGKSVFPSKHALTSLIGQSVKIISDEEYFNADILHKVLTGTDIVRKRCINTSLEGVSFKIMHPIDVLGSRLMNLYKLTEKQNSLGTYQLTMAIEVVQCFTNNLTKQQEIDATIKSINILALSDAGRKVAKRWNIHVADAIDPATRKNDESFLKIQLPQLMELMSPDYAASVKKWLNGNVRIENSLKDFDMDKKQMEFKDTKIYDNGGKTFDRYTAVYLDQPENNSGYQAMYSARGMSEHPFDPQGFGQSTTAVPGRHLGKLITFEELPPDCQKLVRQDQIPYGSLPDALEYLDRLVQNGVEFPDAAYKAAQGFKVEQSELETLYDESQLLKPEKNR